MTSLKHTRSRKTIDIKYEIIKYYDSIEHTGRGAKAKTITMFNLPRISSLNTILSQRNEIIRLFESNKSSASRVRLTLGRVPVLDEKLYDRIEEIGEMTDQHLMVAAREIRDELLKDYELPDEERSKLLSFKASPGFVKTFKNRHNIRFNNSPRETASGDDFKGEISNDYDEIEEQEQDEKELEDDYLPVWIDESHQETDQDDSERLNTESDADTVRISNETALQSFYNLKQFFAENNPEKLNSLYSIEYDLYKMIENSEKIRLK